MIKYNLKKYFDEAAKNGVSLRKISRITGLSHVTLINLNKAKNIEDHNITLKVIDKLCIYFKKTPGDLIEYRRIRK